MMNRKRKVKLAMIGFRADPAELEIFDSERSKTQTTRSKLLRDIFNNFIKHLKQQQHETNDIKRI